VKSGLAGRIPEMPINPASKITLASERKAPVERPGVR